MKRIFLWSFLALAHNVLFLPIAFSQEKPASTELIFSIDAPASKDIVDSLVTLANEIVYGQPEQSIQYAKMAQQMAQQMAYHVGEAKAINAIGAGHWSMGNLREGLTHFNKSKELAAKIKDENLVARNIGNVGIIYAMAGNPSAALAYYQEALPLFIEKNNQERIIAMKNNIGKSYIDLLAYDSAAHFLEIAQKMAETYQPRMLPIITFNLADLKFRQQLDSQALNYIKTSLALSEQLQDQRGIARSLQLKAELLMRQSPPNMELALSLAKEAYQIAEHTKIKELIYISAGTLAKTYAALEDYPNAYHYQLVHSTVKDSVQNKATKDRLDFSEYEKKQKDIQLLKEENRFQRHQIYGLSGLFLVASLLALSLYRLRRLKQKAHAMLRKSHAEIKSQAKELAEINHTKDRLFSIIGHDLRGPLNSLKSFLWLANEKILSPDELQMMLAKISRSVDEAVSLTENLLFWAKNQLNGLSVSPIDFNFGQLAKEEIDHISQQAEHKGVKLVNQLPEKLLVKADRDMIGLILRNLLNNALKFCNKGDSIFLNAEKSGASRWKILVKDTGKGIEPNNLRLMFSQTTFSTRGTQGEKGTGLGLALCKSFIEKNNGQIGVESQSGTGSTFWFTLVQESEKNNGKEGSALDVQKNYSLN